MRSRVSGVAGACLRLPVCLRPLIRPHTPQVDKRILHRRIAGVTFYSVELRESEDDEARTEQRRRRRTRAPAGGDPGEVRCAAGHGQRYASRSPLPPAAGSWDWASPAASGGANPAGRYFIASTTKLYVTALVLQLRAEGRLDLRAPAASYLDPALLDGIHVLRGVDSSARITVQELLSHTSGIADYFEQRRRDGSTQIGRALAHDFSWTLDDVLRITREDLEPRFAPSTPGKAFYSDTNYQLLGALVEAVTGSDLRGRPARAHPRAARSRATPIPSRPRPWTGTRTSTRCCTALTRSSSHRRWPRCAPTEASSRRRGTASSSSRRSWQGRLFPRTYLDELQPRWNHIFGPLEYGVGLMRFALPRYYTMFRRVPPMVGHSGASGAVLYYVRELDLYVSGTVNQVKKRSLSYNLLARLVMACQSEWGA